MKFHDYFHSLGFTQKEAEIYLALYRLGSQPASIVAKHVGMERTYVYKALVELTDHNLVSVTEKQGVKRFFVADIHLLRKRAEAEALKFRQMEEEFHAVEAELVSMRPSASSALPKITIHEGDDGIRNLYDDVFAEMERHQYLSCRLFASNTIASQSGRADTIAQYADDFFKKMERSNKHVDALLGNGLLLMESVGMTRDIAELRNLPAANESVQIVLVGKVVYVVVFKDIPFAFKFASEEFADALHFLFDKVGSAKG